MSQFAGPHPAALMEIRLASIEMLSHLALRPATIDAGLSTRWIAPAANQGASGSAAVDVGIAISENNGEMAHSRFVVLEINRICNHNFV